MAIFRKIHVTFWSDSFVSSLEDKAKLFFLYLLTNERTTQLGVYEITKRQIAFDLGYSIDTVSKLISLIEKTGKIKYNDKTCEMAIKNWNKFNKNDSRKVKTLTDKESSNVKDKSLIEYLYSIDTVSIHNQQEEEEEEGEQTKKEELEDRKLKFATSIKNFVNDYSREMLKDFYEYWTEPNISKSKMRFEMEVTWDLNLRLKTWANRQKKFNGTKVEPAKKTYKPLDPIEYERSIREATAPKS